MNKYRTLYKALPFCIEDKENQDILEKENIYKTYTYKSNFANIASSNDNEEFFKAKQKQAINTLYDEQCTSMYLRKTEKREIHFNPMSSTLYVDTQAKAIYIFTNDKDYIDCDTIHEQIKQECNLQESLEELQSYTPSLFLDSTLLKGSKELESNPYLFGETQSPNNPYSNDTSSPSHTSLDESTPIYHFSPKDEDNNLGTLLIFLNSSTLTLLNYSLLNSSLNITLELTHKASQTKQEEAKVKALQQTQSKKQTIPLSTSYLHPVLEDNEIKCSHGGVVQLKSNLGKTIQSNNIPFILESDLLYSSIVGCPNPPLSGGPCTQVALILPSSRGSKKHNEDYPIMQSLVSSGVFSDKGVPLICTPKPNTYKINAPNPTSITPISKEELLAQIDSTPLTLNIITPFQDLREYYLTPSTYEERESKDSQANFYTPNTPIDIELKPLNKKQEDYQDLKDNPILKSLLEELLIDYRPNSFSYRILTLRIAYSIYEYILIIPKTIPSFIYKLLKEQRNQEDLTLGYGRFINLQRDYIRHIENTKEQHYSNALTLNIQGKILLCPSGMEKIRLKVG